MALTLASSVAGFLVLRRAGRGQIERLSQVRSGDDLAVAVAGSGGLLTGLAGIFLLRPGFITDLAGLLLLSPMVRRRFGATIRRVAVHGSRRSEAVVDLGQREWRRIPDPGSQNPPER